MKITDCFKVRTFVLAAVLGTGLGFVSPAFGQSVTSWIIGSNGKGLIQLGTLGGRDTRASDINDAGQVVGSSRTAGGDRRAFITGPNGVGMTDLGTLGGNFSIANSINAAGQVVGVTGTSRVNQKHAFITGPNGVGMTDLGTLGGESSSSVATGINAGGQVAGRTYTTVPIAGDNSTHAFITGPNGVGMTDLATLGGSNNSADGINDAGQVVGYSSNAGGHFSAFITGPNGVGMTDLGTLDGGHTIAQDINAAGQVAGYSYAEYPLAFITGPNGAGMNDLGTLGGNYSIARGVNDAGQVVGVSTTAEGDAHAFITGPNGEGMTDLNSLVSLLAGVVLTQAYGINNLGQVIAVADVSTLPIPEPSSYALMLAGLGLVGFMARRKKLEKWDGRSVA